VFMRTVGRAGVTLGSVRVRITVGRRVGHQICLRSVGFGHRALGMLGGIG
jgi:hypothetical protein